MFQVKIFFLITGFLIFAGIAQAQEPILARPSFVAQNLGGLAPDNISFPPNTPSVILSWPASAPYTYTLHVIDQTDKTARDYDSNCDEPGAYLCLTDIGVTALSVPVIQNHSYAWNVTSDYRAAHRTAHFAIARPVLYTEPTQDNHSSAFASILFIDNKPSSLVYAIIIVFTGIAVIFLNRFITSRLPKEEIVLSREPTKSDALMEHLK